MASYKIEWTRTAELSLYEILDFYITQNNNTIYSTSLYEEIKTSIAILCDYPRVGKSINFQNYRELVLDRNSIFYRIKPETIEILLIWDNRREPKELYNKLKKG